MEQRSGREVGQEGGQGVREASHGQEHFLNGGSRGAKSRAKHDTDIVSSTLH